MEVITYLKIIARYWWLILLAALVSTGVAAGLSLTRAKSYSTQALVVVRPATGVLTKTNDLVNMMSELGTRSVLGTFAQLLTSADVKNTAQASVGLSPLSAVDYPLEANVLPDTTVIEVSGKGPDPKLLSSYINATVTAAVANSTDMFQVLELHPLQQATVPLDPSSPIPSRDIPIGAALGVFLGVMLALAIDYLRNPQRQEVPYETKIRSLVPDGLTSYSALSAPSQSPAHDEIQLIGGRSDEEYRGTSNRPDSTTGPLTEDQASNRRTYLLPGRK
ncbi:MAG TPA: Wzz/FepE/Etk N-terminal domain-containing protein [Chloroflexia bacterium]|nr:Wzz/FepE/Etk N-terminal domain-containing protein [Chloroflexia bacterium]